MPRFCKLAQQRECKDADRDHQEQLQQQSAVTLMIWLMPYKMCVNDQATLSQCMVEPSTAAHNFQTACVTCCCRYTDNSTVCGTINANTWA